MTHEVVFDAIHPTLPISSLAYVALKTSVYETSNSEDDTEELAWLDPGECVIILGEKISETPQSERYWQIFVLSSVGPVWIDNAETYLVNDLSMI